MFNFNNFINFFNSTTQRIKTNYLYYFAMPDKSDIEYNQRTGRGHPRGVVIAKLYNCGNFIIYQFSFTGMRANYTWMKSKCSLGSKKIGGSYQFLYEKTSTFINYQFSFVGMRAKYAWMKSKYNWVKSKYILGSKKIGGSYQFLYENFRIKILKLKPVKVLTFEEVISKGEKLPQPPLMTYSPKVPPLSIVENINKGTISLLDKTAFSNCSKTKPDNGYILTISQTSEILPDVGDGASMDFLKENTEAITKNKTLLSTKKLKGKHELDLINKILKQSQKRIDHLKEYRGLAAANLQAKIDCIENDDDNSELYKDVSKVMEPRGSIAEQINGNPVKNEYINVLNTKFRVLEKEAQYSEQLLKEVPYLLENFAILKAVSDPKLITDLENHSKSLNPLQAGLARLLLQKRAINSREWYYSVYQAYKVETKNPNLTEEEFSEIFNKVCHHKIDTDTILPNLINIRNTQLYQASDEITQSYRRIDRVVRNLAQKSHDLTNLLEKQNIGNAMINVMENNERIQLGFNFDFIVDNNSNNHLNNEQIETARSLKLAYLLEFQFSLIDAKIQTELHNLLSDQEDLIEYAKTNHGQQSYFSLPERDPYPSLVSLPDDNFVQPTLQIGDLQASYKLAKKNVPTDEFENIFYTNGESYEEPAEPAPEPDLEDQMWIALGLPRPSRTAASTDNNNEYIEKVLPFDEALVERINMDLPPSKKIYSLAELPSTETQDGYQLIDETPWGIPYKYSVQYEQYAYYQNYFEFSKGRPNNMIIIPESGLDNKGVVRPRKFELDEIDEENVSDSTDREEDIRVVARQIQYIEENARLGDDWASSHEYQSEMTQLTRSPAYVAQYLNTAYKTMDNETLELVELATKLAHLDVDDLVSQLPYKQVEKSLSFLNHTRNFPQIKKHLDTYLEYYYPTKIPGIGGVCDTVVYNNFNYPYIPGMNRGEVNQLIEKSILTDFANYKKNCKTRLLCDLLVPLQYLENARFNTYKKITVDHSGNVNRPLIFTTRDNNLLVVREYSQQLLSEIQELTTKDFNIEEMHNAREAYMSKFCLNQVVETLPSILLSEINPTRLDQETFDLSDAIDVHNLNPSNHVQIPELGFRRLSSSYEELMPTGVSSSSSKGETSAVSTIESSRVSPQTLSIRASPFKEIERIKLLHGDLIHIANSELRLDDEHREALNRCVPQREQKASKSLSELLSQLKNIQKELKDGKPRSNAQIIDELREYVINGFIPKLNDDLQQKLDNEFLQKLDPAFFVNREQEFQNLQQTLLTSVSRILVTSTFNDNALDDLIKLISIQLTKLEQSEVNFLQNKANDLRLEAISKTTAYKEAIGECGTDLNNLKNEWINKIIDDCESITFSLLAPASQAKNRGLQTKLLDVIDAQYTAANMAASDILTRYNMETLTDPNNHFFHTLRHYDANRLEKMHTNSHANYGYQRGLYLQGLREIGKLTPEAAARVLSAEVPYMREKPELAALWEQLHKSWCLYATVDMILTLKMGLSIPDIVRSMEETVWENAEERVARACEESKESLDSKFLYTLMDTQPLSLRLPWFKKLYDEIGNRESLNEDQKRLYLFKEKLRYQSKLDSKTSTDVISQTEDSCEPEVSVSISDTQTKNIINSSETSSGESTVILLPENVKLDDVKNISKLASTDETIKVSKLVSPSKELVDKAFAEGTSMKSVFDTLYPETANQKSIFDTLDPENLYPLPAELTPLPAERTPDVQKSMDAVKHPTAEKCSTSESVTEPDQINEKPDYSLTPAERLTTYLLAQEYTISLPLLSKNLNTVFDNDPALATIDINVFGPDTTLGSIDLLIKSFSLTDKQKQQELPTTIIHKLEDRWGELTQVLQQKVKRHIIQWIQDYKETTTELLDIRTKHSNYVSNREKLMDSKIALEDDVATCQQSVLDLRSKLEASAQLIKTDEDAAAYSEGADELMYLIELHSSLVTRRTELQRDINQLMREERMCTDAVQVIFKNYCEQVLDEGEVVFSYFNAIIDSLSDWVSTFRDKNAKLATKLTDLQAKQQIITTYRKLFEEFPNDPNVPPAEKAYAIDALERAQKKLDYITAEYLKLFCEREQDFIEHAELLESLPIIELWPMLNPFNESTLINTFHDMVDKSVLTEYKEDFALFSKQFNLYITKFPDHFRKIAIPVGDIGDPAEYKIFVEPVNTNSFWYNTIENFGNLDDNKNIELATKATKAAQSLWSMMSDFDTKIGNVDDNENADLSAQIYSLATKIYNLELNLFAETNADFKVYSTVMDVVKTIAKIKYSSLITAPLPPYLSPVLSEFGMPQIVKFIKKFTIDSDPTIIPTLTSMILKMKELLQYSNEHYVDLTKVVACEENPEQHLDAYLYGGENQLLTDYLDYIFNRNSTFKTGLYHKKYLLPQNLQVIPAQDRLEFLKYFFGYNPLAASVIFNPILNKIPIKLVTALQLGKSVRMSPAPGCISYSHLRYFLELQTNLLRPEVFLKLLDFKLFSLTAPDTVVPPMAYGAVLRKMTQSLAESPLIFYIWHDHPEIQRKVNKYFNNLIENPRWGQEDCYRILFDILNSRRVGPNIKVKILNFFIGEPHLHFSVQLQILAGYRKFLLKELPELYLDCSTANFTSSYNFYKQLKSQLVYKNKSALITADSALEKSYLSQPTQVINVQADEPLYRLYFSQLTPTRDEFFVNKHIQLYPKLHVYFLKCHEKINQLTNQFSNLITIPLSKIIRDTSNIRHFMVTFFKQSYASQPSLLPHFNLIEKVKTFITDIKRGFNDSQNRSNSPNEVIPEATLNLMKPVVLSQTDLNVPKSDLSRPEPMSEIQNPFKKSQLNFSEKDAIPYITIESYKILPRPNRRIDPFPFRGRKGKVIDYLNFRIKLLDFKKLLTNITNDNSTMIRPLLETPGSILNLKLLNISIFMKDLGAFLGLDISFLDMNPNSEMCKASNLNIPLLKGKIQELPDSEQLTETQIYDLLLRQNLAPQVKPHFIKYNEILVYNRFKDFLGSKLKICLNNFLLSNYIKIEDKSPYLDLPLAQLAAHVLIRVNDGLIYTFRFLGIKDNLTQITIFTDTSYLSFIHFIRTENNWVNKKGLYIIPHVVYKIINGFEQLPSYTNKFNLFVTTKPKPKYHRINKGSFVRNKTQCYFIQEYKLNSAYNTNNDIYLITGDKKPIQIFTNLSSYNEFLNPALRSLLQFDFGYLKIADLHPGSGINSKFVSNINYKINVDKSLSMSPKIGFFLTFQNSTNKNIGLIFADPFKQFSDFVSIYGFFIRQKIRQSLYQYFKLTELRSNNVILKQTFLQQDQNFLTQFINLPYWFNYIWLDDQMKVIAQWVYAYRQHELVLKINRQLYKTLKSYNILGTIYAAPSQKINPLTPVSFKERFRYFLLQQYTSDPHRVPNGFFQTNDSRLAPGFTRLNIVQTYLKKQFEYAMFKRDTGLRDKTQELSLETEILETLMPIEKKLLLPSFIKFKKPAKNNLIRELDNYIFKVEESIIQLLGNPLVSKLSQTSTYLKAMVFKLINAFQQLRLEVRNLNFPFAREVSKFSLYSSGQEIFKFMLSIYNVVDLKVFDLDSRLFSNMLLILLPIYHLVVKKVGNQLVQGNFSLKTFINKLNVNKEKFSFDTVDFGYNSRLPYWNERYATNLVQYLWSKSNQSKIKPLICSIPNETVTFSNGSVLPLSQIYKHASILQLQQSGNKYATFFNIRAIKFQLTELMFFLFKSIEKLVGTGLNLTLPNLNYIARIAILDSNNFNGGMILWHIQHNSLYCELFTPTSRTRKKIKLNRLSLGVPSRHVDKVYHCGTKIRYDTDIQSHGDTKQIIFRFKNTNHLTIGQFAKFDKFKEIDDLYDILKKDKLNLADTLKKVKLFEFKNPNVTQFMTKRKKQKMAYLIYMANPNVSGIKVKTPVKSIFDNGLDWKLSKIQGTHIPILLRPANHIRSTIGDFVEPNDQIEPLKIPSSEQKDKKLMDSQTKEVILSSKGKGIMALVYETISDFIKSELFSWITFQEFREELLRHQNDITPYGIISQCISALTQGLLSGFMLFAADFRRAPNTKKSARLLSCKVILFSGLMTVVAFGLIHYGGVDLLAELVKLSKWFFGSQRIPQPVIQPIQLNSTLDDYDTSIFSTPYYAVRKSNWGIIETVGNFIEASKKMLKVVRDIDIDNLDF